MKNTYKYIIAIVIVIVIAGGLYSGYKYLWWFTPAYSQRQAVQSLLSDLSAGKTSQAYKLTTENFQSKNSYTDFQSKFNWLTGSKLQTSYTKYTTQNGNTVINGIFKNATTHQTVSGFTAVVADSKIDAIAVQTATTY